MNDSEYSGPIFIGWDVGGWNCDRNTCSRDALVVLDSERNMIGQPWRDNVRRLINEAADRREWIRRGSARRRCVLHPALSLHSFDFFEQFGVLPDKLQECCLGSLNSFLFPALIGAFVRAHGICKQRLGHL